MAYKQTKTIGGTAVSAILNVNPWAGPWDAWQRILYNVQAEESEAMRRGTRLEGPIADVLGPRLGMVLVEPLEGTITIDDTFSATADRLGYVNGKLEALIEIKTAGTYGKIDPMPEHYRLQLQHYLWAFGINVGYLAGLKTTNETFRILDTAEDVAFAISRGAAELVIHKIERDPLYESEVIPMLRDWFERHVVGGLPPAADGSDACKAGLARYYSERDGEMKINEEIKALIVERERAREREAEAKEHKASFDNRIRAALGNHKRAYGDGFSVNLSRQKGRQSLDQKRLKDDHPAIWAEYQKRGADFETLRIKADT